MDNQIQLTSEPSRAMVKAITDHSSNHTSQHSVPAQLALTWLFVFVSFVGMVGNSFSIYLLSSQGYAGRHTRILSRAYRVYIIALAVADNGMLFFTGILRYVVVDLMYETTRSSGFYEIYLCRWHRLLMHTFHNAAVWLLVVMAVDRFVAVCFPFRYREIKHDSVKAIKVTCGVFFLSFVFATPFLAAGPVYDENHGKPERKNLNTSLNLGNSTLNYTNNPFPGPDKDHKIIGNPENSYVFSTEQPLMFSNISSNDEFVEDSNRIVLSCSLTATLSDQTAYALNMVFHVCLAFLFPYFVLLLLNMITLRCLHYPSRQSSVNTRQIMNRKITIMMLVVCFTFIVLWLPQALILITSSDAHSHNCNKNEIITSLAALSGLLNSALNFILYCMTVKRFRVAAWIAIQGMCCCKVSNSSFSSREPTKSTWSAKESRDKKSKTSSSHKHASPSHYGKLKVVYNGNKSNGIDQVTLLITNTQDSSSDKSINPSL